MDCSNPILFYWKVTNNIFLSIGTCFVALNLIAFIFKRRHDGLPFIRVISLFAFFLLVGSLGVMARTISLAYKFCVTEMVIGSFVSLSSLILAFAIIPTFRNAMKVKTPRQYEKYQDEIEALLIKQRFDIASLTHNKSP